MKQKITEALRQEYKGRLELSEEALEGVATFGTTYVKTDEEISNFVKGAEPLLKAFQSKSDKLRTEYSARIREQEAKIKDLEDKAGKLTEPANKDQNQEPAKKDNQQNEPSMAELIAAAVKQAVEPLTTQLNAFKEEKTAKEALALAQTNFKNNDYVKKYTEQADDAWERTMEIYELGGNKMSSEEIVKKAMGYFDKAVAKKGIDTSKPLDGSANNKADEFDVEEIKRIYQASGRLPKDDKTN
jgi:hypothetical protein